MLYYSKSNIDLYHGDANQIIPTLEKVDVIFADPPFFLSGGGTTCVGGKRVSVNKASWDAQKSIQGVYDFNNKWISNAKSILKDKGTIWICGTHHNIFSVGLILQRQGFKILNNIIWQKKAPPPNLSCKYFTHSYENIIWASKLDKYYFDYAQMKQINGGKQMKDIWTIGRAKKSEKTHGKHPTQKPEELLERIILASSKVGDIICDPFNGSGTTGVIAKRLGRKYIGIDTNKDYLDLTIKRL